MPRWIALAAALVAGVVAVNGLVRTDACEDARDRVAAAAGARSADLAPAAREVAGECDRPRDLIDAAVFADGARDRASALLLARAAADKAPGSYLGWLAVGRLGRGAEARAALARARELNARAVDG
jgi:hypothetical protein